MLVFPMDTEGVTLRPIELIDGGFEVNEVFFEDVRVPGDALIGEENQGWTLGEVPARQRAGRRRAGRRHQADAGHAQGDRRRRPGLLDDPLVAAQIVELENELLALELTALRVVANSTDGKPHPASSVLKLKGTELQQAVSELARRPRRPARARLGRRPRAPTSPTGRGVATPNYLNLRKASIYGGSNEIQRQIIAGTILGL